jgi:hypothetical protein
MMQGHVVPQWDIEYLKNLPFIESNYSSKKFNALNNLANPGDASRYQMSLYQLRDQENNPNFKFIHESFPWLKNKKCQINKLSPGNILPRHSDVYKFYNETFNISDDSKIFKVLIFVEDWSSGHYVEIKDHGFANWKAGDWISFRLTDLHLTANLGVKDRYAIQITGTI